MKRTLKLKMTVLAATVCLSMLLAIGLSGCSKKQDQNGKTPPDANSGQKQQTQTPASTSQQLKTSSPPAAADTNQLSQISKTTENLPESGSTKLSASAESSLKQFDALTDSDQKIEFIGNYTDTHPKDTVALVNKALDDKDENVRTAAMEALADKELPGAEVIPLVQKAIKDTSEQVRQSAVEACSNISSPQVGKILAQAIADKSEDIRAAALSVADDKDKSIRLDVLKLAITSPYEDVKNNSVSSLTDMSSPQAVDVLINALKDPNPQFHEDVKSAINFLVSQDFETYDQAKQWWDANRNKFDEELSEKEAK